MAKGRNTSSGESRSWGGPGSSSSPANIPPVGTVPNSSFAAPGSGSGGSDSSCSSALAPTAGAFHAGAGPPKVRGSSATSADHSGDTSATALAPCGSGKGGAGLHSDCAGAGGAAPQASIAGSAEATAAAQSGPARSELQSAPPALGRAPASGVEAPSKSAAGASGCHSCTGSAAGTVDQVSSGAGIGGAGVAVHASVLAAASGAGTGVSHPAISAGTVGAASATVAESEDGTGAGVSHVASIGASVIPTGSLQGVGPSSPAGADPAGSCGSWPGGSAGGASVDPVESGGGATSGGSGSGGVGGAAADAASDGGDDATSASKAGADASGIAAAAPASSAGCGSGASFVSGVRRTSSASKIIPGGCSVSTATSAGAPSSTAGPAGGASIAPFSVRSFGCGIPCGRSGPGKPSDQSHASGSAPGSACGSASAGNGVDGALTSDIDGARIPVARQSRAKPAQTPTQAEFTYIGRPGRYKERMPPIVQIGARRKRQEPPRPGPDAYLPVSLDDARRRGWEQLDVVLINGDAYVDHPTFGVPLIGRLLASRGFKVGVVSQPRWDDASGLVDFAACGRPRLFFGVSSGNMDAMVNHYTAGKKRRSSDAYTPDAAPGRRTDYAADQ